MTKIFICLLYTSGIRQIAGLPDPIGEAISSIKRPNGLKISKVRVPLGVIGIIYEARPNVTADAAGLCIKSGNSVILRGGKEAFKSNMAIVKVMQDSGYNAGLPVGSINLVENTTRESSTELMKLNDYLDAVSYTHLDVYKRQNQVFLKKILLQSLSIL